MVHQKAHEIQHQCALQILVSAGNGASVALALVS